MECPWTVSQTFPRKSPWNLPDGDMITTYFGVAPGKFHKRFHGLLRTSTEVHMDTSMDFHGNTHGNVRWNLHDHFHGPAHGSVPQVFFNITTTTHNHAYVDNYTASIGSCCPRRNTQKKVRSNLFGHAHSTKHQIQQHTKYNARAHTT